MMTQQKQHILSEKKVVSIDTWKQWKEAFQEETRDIYLKGLIFSGFEAKVETDEEEAERLMFLMDLADTCYESLQPFGFNEKEAKIRNDLSEIAFKTLSRNFFKNSLDDFSEFWFHPLRNPEVLKKIFWFFRRSYYGIYNLNGNHHYVEVAKKFITEICSFIWEEDFSYLWRELNEEQKETYRKARADTIEILIGLKKINMLLGSYKNVDSECLDRLEKFVMNEDVSILGESKLRKPNTIEEACLDSSVARVLFLLKKMISMREKFEKLSELSDQEREIEKKRKEIILEK
jgi:hypothetical protein